jgi:hypothetical protein
MFVDLLLTSRHSKHVLERPTKMRLFPNIMMIKLICIMLLFIIEANRLSNRVHVARQHRAEFHSSQTLFFLPIFALTHTTHTDSGTHRPRISTTILAISTAQLVSARGTSLSGVRPCPQPLIVQSVTVGTGDATRDTISVSRTHEHLHGLRVASGAKLCGSSVRIL